MFLVLEKFSFSREALNDGVYASADVKNMKQNRKVLWNLIKNVSVSRSSLFLTATYLLIDNEETTLTNISS